MFTHAYSLLTLKKDRMIIGYLRPEWLLQPYGSTFFSPDTNFVHMPLLVAYGLKRGLDRFQLEDI